ncbi:uncharacterized protein CcaverHIS019_0205480 [Cutaneotrichosporon cavernicola]|uniref:Uncharacterized protein n=1 Tax=Cutaneotrichosporon cavernicola TaxID=279322 RepID=A0AA48I142_9TREE|nr:uncharacterized protein CcaverHIS019_0205480 [Cutaneotrichosporon cavernicola]BEI89186.1 hypothetical protein CcaverHIS019_0205480 [Cutaneotrichosporon cavernicola]
MLSTLASAPSFAPNQTPLSSGPSSTASYSSVQSQSFPQNGQPPGYVATTPQVQPNGLPASANIVTPFSSTASLSGSSPHRTELSQTSSYSSSPHSAAAPLDQSPQISASPYTGSMALSSFNASLSTSSWSPSGNLATQHQPGQIPQGPSNSHQAQGTVTQQQAYGVFSEQSHKSSPVSGPYQTKASKATRVQTLAPAAAARVQDIARRCAIAAKATRTTERAASNTSRSTGTGSSGSPGDHRRASVSDASGTVSLVPPFSELSPHGSGSTDMPPPPVPRQGQMGIPSTSFPAQQMNVNGKVPTDAQSYAAFVPKAPGQSQQTLGPPAQPWSWPPSAPI